jgi:hypothetical protein
MYVPRIKYDTLPDASPPETFQAITHAQGLVGKLIYNTRAMDPTFISPLSTLAPQLLMSAPANMDAISHLLDYSSTQPESSIGYYASDMQLNIHSDASYLSEPKAKSRIVGYPQNPSPMACHSMAIKIITTH